MLSDHEVTALGEKGWFSRDSFLGAEPARAAHAEIVAWAMRGHLRPAGISRDGHLDPDVRADATAWLDPAQAGPALTVVHDRFAELGLHLTQSAWLGLGRMDIQIAHYPGSGARYARHRDSLSGPESRRITATWYANPEWHPAHGGILRLYPDGQRSADLEPVLDRLVVFLSEKVEHEVLPAWAERYAVTAWYYGRSAG
jgi:SM-20-related protein